MSFWDTIFANNKTVLGLSPMDGVTDAPFRYMVGKYGKPDVLFTEFVSVDALAHVADAHKAEMVLRALVRSATVPMRHSRPAEGWPYEVAQVFGNNPELFYKAAVLVATLGFDGMDINMGCPATKVQELGSGAGLIRTPEIAQEIVRQAKRGIADYAAGKVSVGDLGYNEEVVEWVRSACGKTSSDTVSLCHRGTIPVSVKTRIGVDRDQVEEWIPTIMQAEPAVLSLHGRTLKQLYQGRSDWEAIGRAAEIVHSMGGKILGNGDVKSILEAEEKVRKYGVDGVLIGRAAEGNPGVFAGIDTPSREGRLAWLFEHARVYNDLFVQCQSDTVSQMRAFMPLRKHLAWYATGFKGASEMRQQLVVTNSLQELDEKLSQELSR